MWHASSRSGVATLRAAIHLLLTYLLEHLRPLDQRSAAPVCVLIVLEVLMAVVQSI